MDAERVLSLIAPDLEQVQIRLTELTASRVEAVARMGTYIQAGGGKKLRPGLLLLSAGLFGPVPPAARELGAVVELLHLATLVHDDIIDDTPVRRGRPAPHTAFGPARSVLLGDWLYMTAFHTVVELRSFPILDILMTVTRRMVEGEILQLDLLGRTDITVAQSLDIAERKTGGLIAACAELGGLVAGRPAAELEALRQLGRDLGLAFQLADDILDFTADANRLGKPVLGDLKEGKVTLPVVDLLEHGDPATARLVRTVVDERGFRSVQADHLLAALQSGGALARTRERAATLVRRAQDTLSTFPDSPYRHALIELAGFIVKRSR